MIEEEQQKTKIKPGVSSDFKMGMVILTFFITCFHLFEVVYLPGVIIIPNEILLAVVLFDVVYLWIQEVRDRKKLEITNNELFVAQEELKRANLDTMKALIVSEEARDPYLTGHSRRVTEYTLAIADRMNISEKEKKHMEYAGYLHDIGKIGISDAILHKEGKLNEEEWKAIKMHPTMGVEILDSLKFLPKEKFMIRHHHERYDGKGYPDGIKGSDIPLGARILAVADSFDAMNSRRSYRAPLTREKIISELKTGCGTQFDPKIVDIFLEIVKTNKNIFKK